MYLTVFGLACVGVYVCKYGGQMLTANFFLDHSMSHLCPPPRPCVPPTSVCPPPASPPPPPHGSTSHLNS